MLKTWNFFLDETGHKKDIKWCKNFNRFFEKPAKIRNKKEFKKTSTLFYPQIKSWKNCHLFFTEKFWNYKFYQKIGKSFFPHKFRIYKHEKQQKNIRLRWKKFNFTKIAKVLKKTDDYKIDEFTMELKTFHFQLES